MRTLRFFVKRALAAAAACLMSFAVWGCGAVGGVGDSDAAERTSYLMNTVVEQLWYGENAEEVCDEIEEALQSFEKKISLYIEDSEINKINAAAGKEYVSVSDETFELIARGKSLSEQSGGVFDITIGSLCLLWDVSGQSGQPHVPDADEIEKALEKIDYGKILSDEENNSVMLADEGMALDLGGIGKGYSASLVRSIAEENGVSGYLYIGGNMLVIGDKPTGDAFVIGIRDPLKDSNSYFATIDITGYTMASSSAAEIYFEEDGVKYHHILDPNTGYPCETDLLQVSVIAEDGALADALSTTIFIKGSDCLEEYMQRDDCMVIAVTDEQEVYASKGAWELMTPTNTEDYNFVEG